MSNTETTSVYTVIGNITNAAEEGWVIETHPEFINSVKTTGFTFCDEVAYWAILSDSDSDLWIGSRVTPDDYLTLPSWATHVAWYGA